METSQLICRANQLTGFYVRGTLTIKGLIVDLIVSADEYFKKFVFCQFV